MYCPSLYLQLRSDVTLVFTAANFNHICKNALKRARSDSGLAVKSSDNGDENVFDGTEYDVNFKALPKHCELLFKAIYKITPKTHKQCIKHNANKTDERNKYLTACLSAGGVYFLALL